MLSTRYNLSRVDVKFFSFKKWQKMGTLKKRENFNYGEFAIINEHIRSIMPILTLVLAQEFLKKMIFGNIHTVTGLLYLKTTNVTRKIQKKAVMYNLHQ